MVYCKIILDIRRKKDSDIYPVKLRITYNRSQKYYLLGYKMTKVEFEEVMKNPTPKKYHDARTQLNHLELKAKRIITDLEAFSFNQFEEKYFKNDKAGKSIYELYDATIKNKTVEGRISTAINYRCSMNSLKKFKSLLAYVDVTPQFLKKYESYLLAKGKSISTVGIYLRPLRAILNEAIQRKYLQVKIILLGLKSISSQKVKTLKKRLQKRT